MKAALVILVVLASFSCSVINETSKYEFKDGVYTTRSPNQKASKTYITISPDSILITPLTKRLTPDTNQSYKLAFPPTQTSGAPNKYHFTRRTIDLDLLTILFKYRPSVAGFPSQLNTNLNGAFYFGFRSDRYSVNYLKTPLNSYKKNLTHFGYSLGVFTGLGSSAINPWVTNNQVALEYDGVVIPYGIATIVGINNISFGLTIGIDHLIDKNSSVWIYRGKPWAGLALGLNLN